MVSQLRSRLGRAGTRRADAALTRRSHRSCCRCAACFRIMPYSLPLMSSWSRPLSF